jgi:hypothetical protein
VNDEKLKSSHILPVGKSDYLIMIHKSLFGTTWGDGMPVFAEIVQKSSWHAKWLICIRTDKKKTKTQIKEI